MKKKDRRLSESAKPVRRLPSARTLGTMSVHELRVLQKQLQTPRRRGGNGGHETRDTLKAIERRLKELEK